ncbi:kelch domain-containing protein 7A [Astyanax mexicanus]|uniref:Kelch domain-containing protein 7A n=1 Tax=Astyanax mexicanus TaxID=7994 RepID=A0A8B9JY86_ASTMX|nr:kelch domain-containing protein 7A [Astyanax mexicanus]
MPIADLLGVRFDMQLLGKLTLSVAAILLISWAYRFYSSRAQGQTQTIGRTPLPRGTQTGAETCSNCKTVLQPQKKTAKEEANGESQSRQSSVDLGKDIFKPEESDAAHPCENEESKSEVFAFKTMQYSTSVRSDIQDFCQDAVKETSESKDCKSELTLLLPDKAGKSSTTVNNSSTGRRSPCLLRKVDGGIEVGRELRQDLGHLGNFSSFQSKAEIKMENADLVLEGTGNQNTGVRGKIYDYYVETSSHSISDLSPTHSLSPTFGPYETGNLFDSKLSELSGIMDKPRSPSPLPSALIIRDLELSHDSDGEPLSPMKSEPIKLLRQGLIRKDSYLAAAVDSELQIPFPPPVTSTPCSHSPTVPSEMLQNYSDSNNKEMQHINRASFKEPGTQVQTVARAKFLNFPPQENVGCSELESLKGKLDLGNCLEALILAKKYGHSTLQKSALKVMSDNYFQVLRDPALYGRLKAGERDQIQRQRMRGRRCLMVADMESPEWSRLPSQSTMSEAKKASSGLYYYDDYKDTWHYQCQIPQEVLSRGCAMCTMDNYLFVAVGFQGNSLAVPSRKVFCYNPITSIWSEICPMNEARPHCKLVTLQDHVYAIGGECLSTVERYDPRSNRWSFVAPLPNETFAVAHRATACNGELFVSGGTLKYTLLRYNPKTDVWRQSLIVGSKERTTEMVAVRNFLYRFDVSPTMGISVYRYHAVARLWYECCSKRMPHCPAFQCIAMDDVIYCVSRQFTMRFLADEISPGFVAEDLKVLSAAKGILFPFVLALPDKSTIQTSV